tara:strand:- start:546 stop:1667 length:1122 start_codon:yes stop_codon:yes gene_type:complete
MGTGGSEVTAMWTLQALQDRCKVTFVTASEVDWDVLNASYGTSVDPEKITLLKAPHLPSVDGPENLVHLQLRYFEKFCNSVAGDFDLCISAYNPINFGRRSIQLIGDFSFSEEMRKRLYVYGREKFRHQDSILRRIYLRVGDWIGLTMVPLKDRGDLVLANSRWSAEILSNFFGIEEAPVIYPPVMLPKALSDSERDPLGFVCLGRLVPEKEIERMISILKSLREQGFPVTLRLIGALDGSNYCASLEKVIARESWIQTEGFLMLDEKQSILSSLTFALHACRIEAFGIAVAEMASMGCVPFVPDTGGAGEIVGLPELQFNTDEEAVDKIVALLENPARIDAIRAQLIEEMNRFGPEVFMKELQEHVLEFSGR